jgi:hypothetical protein
MIFLIQNLNKTKISFEKSIEEINKQFNSKFLSKHFQDLLKNFDHFSSNSILIDQSKFLIIKIFEKLLKNFYYLDEINHFLNNINHYFNQIIENDYLKNSFNQFIISYRNILNDFTNLNKKVCYFIDQNHFDIEEKIFSLLNLIRKQFQYFIHLIDQEFIQKFNLNLFNQQQIRSNLSLIINLIIICLTLITIIPITFLILIIINYFYYYNNQLIIQFFLSSQIDSFIGIRIIQNHNIGIKGYLINLMSNNFNHLNSGQLIIFLTGKSIYLL